MDDLVGEFVAETREMLEHIADALIEWEDAPADTARIDEIFRFVHTVKGSCGFLDLPRIATLADAAETILGEVRSGHRKTDAALVTALLGVIDRIGVLVFALEAPDTSAVDEAGDAALIAALDARTAAPHFERRADASPASRGIRIAVPLLDAMMTQLSDVVLIRNELARAVRDVDDPSLTRSLDRLTSALGSLRESVTRTRMQPVERVFAALPRLVRDTATALGKQVTLEVSGQDVEIDREMGEALRDPLLHIVRNAIDHGIEPPVERRAAGKSPTGILRIVASRAGNRIGIAISDDGRGIDIDRLVARAVAAGCIDAERASKLDPVAAAALVFEPGLSTSRAVSGVSGRGVGMDVVRANVERLGGVVHLANDPGQGLTITLRAPLTLSIVTALTVHVGHHRFAIPRASLEEIVPLVDSKARLEDVAGAKLAVVRGAVLPAVVLAAALDIAADAPRLLLVVATPDGRRCAVAVDEVSDHEELVVRAMAPQIAAYGLFAGQSLNEDGVPIVLLDPTALVALFGGVRPPVIAAPVEDEVGAGETIILARAFDGRRVALRTALVDRLVDVKPGDRVVVDGATFVRIDGKLHHGATLGDIAEATSAIAVLLSDGVRRTMLLVASVEDCVPLHAVVPVGHGGVEAIVEGHGDPALLLDALALFARAVPAPFAMRPLAAIALAPGPWAQAILAPMLVEAGYRVHFGRRVDAALTITIEGEDDDKATSPTVALLCDGKGNVAVDRYDRATLADAIAMAGRAA